MCFAKASEGLKSEVYEILDGKAEKGRSPPLWDGEATHHRDHL